MSLAREVSLPSAIAMGLGSILGTGVFVTLGLAAGTTGWSMILALLLAGMVATCNGLSTAQLAAAIPRSGGTYEYANHYLGPRSGLAAGSLFLVAKSASAATAAIGFGNYLVSFLGLPLPAWIFSLSAVVGLTGLALLGIKRGSQVNSWIVAVTCSSLFLFVACLLPVAIQQNNHREFHLLGVGSHFFQEGFTGFIQATALLFVAYTGYGRVATLGGEIRDPQKNIPKAIIWTLSISFLFYLMIAWTSLSLVGAAEYGRLSESGAATLYTIATRFGSNWLGDFVAVGALTAMLGVLFNLLLGISRVIFAMAQRKDMPNLFTKVEAGSRVPLPAILLTMTVILVLVALQDISLAWSFSAFTVLVYYALTNASALRLPANLQLHSPALAWIGLFACLSLAMFIELRVIALGCGTILLAFVMRYLLQIQRQSH